MFGLSIMNTQVTTTKHLTLETILMNLQVSSIKISFIKVILWDLFCIILIRVCVCWSGMSELDYNLYPSREMQLDWLKTYLQAYKLFTKKGEEVSQCELETLYVQVNKFALVRRKCFHNAAFMKFIPRIWITSVLHVDWCQRYVLCMDWAERLLFFCFGRLHISSGVSGPWSKPSTPPSSLTSSGKQHTQLSKPFISVMGRIYLQA